MSGPLTRFGIAVETREQRQEKILAGVIASVYRQVPQSVLGSIVGGVALVAVFWQTHNQTWLLLWSIALLLESLVRIRMAYAFRRAADAVEQALLPAGADAGSGAWAFAGDRRSGIRALPLGRG